MPVNRVVIFVNGELPELGMAKSLLRSDDVLVGANGGTYHLLNLEQQPDLVVGDFDSLEAGTVEALEKAGKRVIRYSSDKDETDLELAINHALELEPSAILLVGALGGRLDQTLANLSLLTREKVADLDVRCDDGVEEVFFIRDRAWVQGSVGDIVSLLPWGNPVTGIHTHGLRWPLSGETLYPYQSRGISNRMTGNLATIQIGSGLLFCIHTRK
ncbi:MAG: thiamine diphosphokinase [Anaerolineales bacterium]|nr:thiamine diphosphokinase [Anaerolineales bacterium]